MKKTLTLLAYLIFGNLYAQEDYKLEINGKINPLELGKNYEFIIEGKKLNIKLTIKDTLQYNDGKLTFKYPQQFKLVSSKLEEGVSQMMVMNAEGSGVIIQKYSLMNPQFLNEMMLNEITKESLNYGYKMKRKEYKRKINSGQNLDFIKAELTYNDEYNKYEITSIGNKDEGYIIISIRMDNENKSEGEQLVESIMNSISIQF
jgi:hypothetical protein